MLTGQTGRGQLVDGRGLMFMLPALLAGTVVLSSYLTQVSSGSSTLNMYDVTPVALLTWLGATGASSVFLKLGKGKHKAEGLAGQPEPGDEPVPYPQSEPAPENPEAIPEGGVPEPLPLGSLSVRSVFRLFKSKGSGSVDDNEAVNQRVEEILMSLRDALLNNMKAGYEISSIEVHMKPISEANQDFAQNKVAGSIDEKRSDEMKDPTRIEETDQLVVAAQSR